MDHERTSKTLIKMAPLFSRAAQSSVALSVARFAIRKIKDSVATEYVASLIGQIGIYTTWRSMR